MSHKRVIQELNAKIAILGDYINKTTKDLNQAIEEYQELQAQLKEVYEDAAK
jgi:predicted MPP superfamily phosphohydrolase